MYNLLEQEDLVKSLPNDYLLQQAQAPSGEIPQFLLIGEIQRRTDIQKRWKKQEDKGTVAEQVIREGIMATQPQAQPPHPSQMPPRTPQQMPPFPQGEGMIPSGMNYPPMPNPNAEIAPQMAGGGLVSLAGGGQTFAAPWNGQTYMINSAGYPTQNAAFDEFLQGRNPPIGDPHNTIGRTTNQISFNPDGTVRETAESGYDKYKQGFQQAMMPDVTPKPSIDEPTLPASSFGPAENMATYDAMAAPAPTEPRPDLVQRAEDLLNPASYGTDMPSVDEMHSGIADPRPEPINMYARGAQQRQDALDNDEVWTLDKLNRHTQAWIDQNAANSKDPSRVDAGGLEGLLGSMGEEDYMSRAFSPIGDAIADDFANAQTQGSEEGEYGGDNWWETVKGFSTNALMGWKGAGIGLPPRTSAADPETAAQNQKAQGQVKPNAASQQAEPTELEQIQARINALTTAEGTPKSARKNPYESKVDFKAMSDQARKDAFSSALIQMGAGIAGNDMQAGLRNAGIAQSRGMRGARALELQGKTYEADRTAKASDWDANEVDRQFDRTVKRLGLDINMAQMNSWAAKNMTDRQRNNLSALEMKITVTEAAIARAFTDGDKEQEAALKLKMKEYMGELASIIPIGT